MKKQLNILILIVCIPAIKLFAQPNRPQEPKGPFSYQIEEVTFDNPESGLKLAGTITTPKEMENFPMVILITGSGAQDRNSEVFGHKPFWVIADHLTKNGIGVFRVDDRGAGESTGDYNSSSLQDFNSDAAATVTYLMTRKDLGYTKIGLLGHSLGGVIAPQIAANSEDIAFIVLLAAPGIRGDKLMLLQKELIERKSGVPEPVIAAAQKNIGGAYDIIVNAQPENDTLKTEVANYFKKIFGGALPEVQVNAIAGQLTLPWMADFIRNEPADALKNVKCPVLALNGTNDLQVPPQENLEAIKSALTSEVTIQELEGLNHLFQESETGLPTEYQQIEQTFSPQALDIIARWILDL